MTAYNSADVRYQEMRELDPDVFDAINGEIARQRETLEMIASENFVPRAVLQAQGSVLTNKYAEGYPGRRYYGAASTLMSSKIWHVSVPRASSALSSLTSSPTPVRRQTLRFCPPWRSRATRSWVCPWHTVATSPTA